MTRGKRTARQRVRNADGEIQEITVQLDDTRADRRGRYLVDPEDAPENQPPKAETGKRKAEPPPA